MDQYLPGGVSLLCHSRVITYSPDTPLHDLTTEELLSRMKAMPINASIQHWFGVYRMEVIQASS